MLRGVVHDPTARRMAGVAGHAGLFSTAADLSIFARMLLERRPLRRRPHPRRRWRSTRMITPVDASRRAQRARPRLGHGFVVSANRGELLPLGSFGHTGWTGTSLWIDPATKMFVVFMSNRDHPDGKGDVTPLRARVATIAASALTELPPAVERSAAWSARDFGAFGHDPRRRRAAPVLSGIDVLRADGFAALRGQARRSHHQPHRPRA